jgi:hypothetical protein|tara:strand:- start:4952 stop:5206 length:255 start_codon:yes stop_codon:yes gene_type:complete
MTAHDSGYDVRYCDECGKELIITTEKEVDAPGSGCDYVKWVLAHAWCGTDGCVPWILQRRVPDTVQAMGPHRHLDGNSAGSLAY